MVIMLIILKWVVFMSLYIYIYIYIFAPFLEILMSICITISMHIRSYLQLYIYWEWLDKEECYLGGLVQIHGLYVCG